MAQTLQHSNTMAKTNVHKPVLDFIRRLSWSMLNGFDAVHS